METKIKQLLQKKGLPARVFCSRFGLNESRVYHFTNRRASVPERWQKPMADILNVAVDEIFDDCGLALLDEEPKVA